MPTLTSQTAAARSGLSIKIICQLVSSYMGVSYLEVLPTSFRSVRNIIIDLRHMAPYSNATGLHWQVSQATSLINIVVEMSREEGNNHQGISLSTCLEMFDINAYS